jgi:hypothetical protein
LGAALEKTFMAEKDNNTWRRVRLQWIGGNALLRKAISREGSDRLFSLPPY